jgi:hypothetical protein
MNVIYDPLITQAQSLIQANCGGIYTYGGRETSIHSDIFLSMKSKYCDCYTYMWNNRANSPWKDLQVIYHEPISCNAPHIHLKKMNTCNYFHFDLDESSATGDSNCNAGDGTQIDKYFCQAGSRKGTCDNPF